MLGGSPFASIASAGAVELGSIGFAESAGLRLLAFIVFAENLVLSIMV